ncbi:MAG TPA: sigma-70 family RNA polymerase sigma factor [Chthoniobacterales bacterium]|nr:sigma-70 family RNA polymerase sigma factor [Chthoniobacterales bacterium]
MNEIAAMAHAQNVEQLLRRFEVPLLQYTTRITGNNERARDVVQETFIKFQRNGSVAPEKTATWLFTVCRNGALNICRKERRLMYLNEAIIESRPDEAPMPFERIEQREASDFLMKILSTLPPRQQEVLQLKFQGDLSYQEIAESTKTTANSVGVLIHTALKTLRQRYAESAKEFLPFEPRTT